MDVTERDRSDKKLLAGVAAAVLLVAAAVVFTGVQLSKGDESPAVARVNAERPEKTTRSIPMPQTLPASLPIAVEPPLPLEEELTIPSDATEVKIDPDADFVAEGERAFSSREFALAAAYFEAETKRRPQSSFPHYMHGLSLWKNGEHAAAESAMARATEMNPVGIKGWINLSRIRNDLGSFEQALSAARSALELEADQPQALFLEGRSLANLGRVDEALLSLDASLETDADNGYVQNLAGLIRLQQGDAPAAVSYLQRAAALRPGVGYVHNNLGMALERSGRMEEAAMAYKRGVEGDPDHVKLMANLTRLEPFLTVDSTIEPAQLASSTEPEAESEVVASIVEPPEAELQGESAEPVDGGTEQ